MNTTTMVMTDGRRIAGTVTNMVRDAGAAADDDAADDTGERRVYSPPVRLGTRGRAPTPPPPASAPDLAPLVASAERFARAHGHATLGGALDALLVRLTDAAPADELATATDLAAACDLLIAAGHAGDFEDALDLLLPDGDDGPAADLIADAHALAADAGCTFAEAAGALTDPTGLAADQLAYTRRAPAR